MICILTAWKTKAILCKTATITEVAQNRLRSKTPIPHYQFSFKHRVDPPISMAFPKIPFNFRIDSKSLSEVNILFAKLKYFLQQLKKTQAEILTSSQKYTTYPTSYQTSLHIRSTSKCQNVLSTVGTVLLQTRAPSHTRSVSAWYFRTHAMYTREEL